MSEADIRAGGAYVEAYMKDDALRKGFDNIQQRLVSMGKQLAGWGAAIGGIGAAIRAPLELAAREFTSMGTELLKLSKETGQSVEALSELHYAAEQSGLSMKEVMDSVKTGKDSFSALRKEAANLGLTLKTADAVGANKLRQALDSLHAVLKRIYVEIGAAVAPVIQETTERFREWAKIALDWVKNHRPLFAMLVKISSVLLLVGTALAAAGGVISAVGTGLGMLGAALAFIISPMGLTIAAVTAGAYAFVQYTEAGRGLVQWIREQLPALKAIAVDTFQGINDALRGGDLLLAGKVLWVGLKTLWYQGLADINKVWMGTFRIMGGAGLVLGASLATGLSQAIVFIETKWVEFSELVLNTWDDVTTNLQVSILRNFAAALYQIDAIWTDIWATALEIVRDVSLQMGILMLRVFSGELIITGILKLGYLLIKTLVNAGVFIAKTLMDLLTEAFMLPLKVLEQLPGMAALAGKVMREIVIANGELHIKLAKTAATMLQKTPETVNAGPEGEGMANKALHKAAELRERLKERQEQRPENERQRKFDADNRGGLRDKAIDDIEKKLHDALYKLDPKLIEDETLSAARKELGDLLNEAHAKRVAAERGTGSADLAKAGAATGGKMATTASGTFNPFAAGGLANSPIVAEQKKTNKKADTQIQIMGQMLVSLGNGASQKFAP